jgi:hypothetical protein
MRLNWTQKVNPVNKVEPDQKKTLALPRGEAPEPPPIKYIEVAPPGWVKRTVTLVDGSTITQWYRPSVQKSTLTEAWNSAIVDAHETLQAVAGRYEIVEDEPPPQYPSPGTQEDP